MGFLTSIFGTQTSIWTVGFALIIVLALIVGGVWLRKLLFGASSNIVRGRQRRLSIVDTMALDNRKSLMLIRRDDVEHLILVSPNNDLVVESSIYAPQALDAR
ncbi:MAG TPA: flagellar biosynthesis protein FliO, partial [Devosia sp.]|nr:flagellar biosynthesis protein FliO [Devosia sp.]